MLALDDKSIETDIKFHTLVLYTLKIARYKCIAEVKAKTFFLLKYNKKTVYFYKKMKK
jgi:hypothetical protein